MLLLYCALLESSLPLFIQMDWYNKVPLEQFVVMKTATTLIDQLNYEDLNILELREALGNQFSLLEVQEAVVQLRRKKQLKPENNFGNCGINPAANPCGDADEY